MTKAYIITNASGTRSGVSESQYNYLKDKDGYTAEIVDGEEKTSTDYTIAELEEKRDDFSDENWEAFIADDDRTSVPK